MKTTTTIGENKTKAIRNIIYISLVLLLGVVTLVTFLTAPEGKTQTNLFWVSWAFAVPFNIIVASILHFVFYNKKDAELVRLPVVYYIMIGFSLAYCAVARMFIYLPVERINELTAYINYTIAPINLLISVEAIITVIYLIVIMYFVFGAEYMARSLKATKEKVLFINLLVADLTDCLPKVKSENVKVALEKFIDNVRYSDPMSHQSLSGIERQLSNTAFDIANMIDTATEEEVLELIKQGEMQLQSRNQRCIMLK